MTTPPFRKFPLLFVATLGLLALITLAPVTTELARAQDSATRPPGAEVDETTNPDSNQQPKTRSRRLRVMGTELVIQVFGTKVEKLETALDAAVEEIQRVEDLMTDWRPSPLLDLNARAGEGPTQTPLEIVRILRQAKEIHAYTGGAFDPTYAAVGKLWDFKRVPPQTPTKEQVAAALPFVDASRLVIDLEKRTVAIPAGMSIGLGGIAKGYGVDRAMAILLEHGLEHAMVNAGGDLKALGKKNGKLWEIAIKHPRDAERVIAVIPISNTCVVTSGDYERFFELDGVRYHHILDPRTGFPSTGAISATVVAPEAAMADAFATALCVLGAEKGIPLIEAVPRVEALIVDLDGEAHSTTGLAGQLREKP